MKKQRKQYAPEEKIAILRRHLLEKEPISKLCDEEGDETEGSGDCAIEGQRSPF